MTKFPADVKHSIHNSDLVAAYHSAGFGGRVGWGERPAILVIDMAREFVDPAALAGADLRPVLQNITRILEAARARGDVPIYYATTSWDPELGRLPEVVRRKQWHSKSLVPGTQALELCPELGREADEPSIMKRRASAFFETPLLALLQEQRVDTTIVVGCSTSACIRSTCEGAFSYNLHAIVPDGAVGDRSPSAHEAALLDIDSRYGDVVSVGEVLRVLSSRGDGVREGAFGATSA